MTPRRKQMLRNLAEGRSIGSMVRLSGQRGNPSGKGGATRRAVEALEAEGYVIFDDGYKLTEKGKQAIAVPARRDWTTLTLELVDKLTRDGNGMGANSKTMTKPFWLTAGTLAKAGYLDRRHMGLNRMYYRLTDKGRALLQENRNGKS